jgi:hypothetical protein
MTLGSKLKSGSLSDWEPLGVSGDPVYRAASQILSLIQKELGNEVAQVLATPLRDDQRLSVDWYSVRDGQVQPWAVLDEAQRAALKALLSRRLAEIEGLSQRLRNQQGETAKTYAGLLHAAQSYPGPECLFSVNGQPVLVYWGFGLPAQGVQKAVPSVVSSVRPQPVIPPVMAAPISEPAFARDTSYSHASSGGSPRSFWQRYGWWALLAFILLAGLLSLMRGCRTDFPLFGPQLGIGKPGANAPGGSLGPPAGPNATGAGAGGGAGGNGDGALAPGGADVHGSTADAGPNITPEALKRNDLSAFGGRWALSSNNVVNSQTGLPVRIDFEFEQNGNGLSKLTEQSGDVCAANARARIQPPDRFALQSEQMTCSGGGKYKPLQIQCAIGEDKQATCELQGKEGPIAARFSRTR